MQYDRLRSNSDFQRVFDIGRSLGDNLLAVYAAPNEGRGWRVGFSAGRALGKAHVRNRLRRRLRGALAALEGSGVPGYDVVIIARRGLLSAPYQALTASLQCLLSGLGVVTGGIAGVRDE